MKKTLLTLIAFMLLSTGLEAQKLKFFKKDGTSEEHLLSEIVKIEPADLSEDYRMKINRASNSAVTIDLATVDKLEYSNGNFLVYIDGSSTSYPSSDITSVEFYIDGGGNEETIVIGEQEWMVRNLDVTHYRNGDAIFHAESNADWVYAKDNGIGAWCYYNNDEDNGAIYGKLYNWYAVNDSRGLAPEGFHVPSDAEWTELTNYLRSDSQYWCNNNSNYIAKSIASKEYWYSSSEVCDVGNNQDANNVSGFTGFPGGYRDYGGYFYGIGPNARWWSSTEYSEAHAWGRTVGYYDGGVSRYYNRKGYGFSVRCVRDANELGLSAPVLQSPENEATEQQIDISFEWEAVSNAETYHLQISTINDFTVLIFDEDGIEDTEFEVIDLEYETEFFWRVRAVNDNDESDWSEVWNFETKDEYETVVIGEQEWMVRNLDVTHYRNGDPIPQVTDPDDWEDLTTGAWCYYNNDEDNGAIYGKLYNWYAVNDSRGLAPEGFHVPSDAEWEIVIEFLGGFGVAGGKMKETGTEHWNLPNSGATNSSGFTALPGGYRLYDGDFSEIKKLGGWWTTTDYRNGAYLRHILYNSNTTYKYAHNVLFGYSVRCVKDSND